MMPVRVRFAPSPTGLLHVGNARTALFNWLFARSQGGVFVLRIEDTDVERSTREAESAIYDDLRWLGLRWDEGPDVTGGGGACGPYRQSERVDLYGDAALRLLSSGAAYRCFCGKELIEAERKAQRSAGQPPRYSGRCRAIPAAESAARAQGEPFALRFQIKAERVSFHDLIRGDVEFPGAQLGDPVIVRADGIPTYNFAAVVDDAAMGITHVIRGEDHISNTPRQILIYAALQAQPPAFAHVSLVLGSDGSPLAKRHGAASVADFRDKGYLPEALVNYLALLGWAHPDGKEILQVDDLVGAFRLERVGHSAAMFDFGKLAWLNGHYLRALTPDSLAQRCRGRLAEAGYVSREPGDQSLEGWIAAALELFSGQMQTLADAVPATRSLFRFPEMLDADAEAGRVVAGLGNEPGAAAVVTAFADIVDALEPPLLADRDNFRQAAAATGRKLGVKGRALYHPIRVALTAAEAGPELDRLVPVIDRGSSLPLPGPLPSCARRARLVAHLLEKRAPG